MKKIMSFLLLFAVTFSSCDTTYYAVKVNSYGDENFSDQKSYILIHSDSTISVNSFEFQEYADYIKRALRSKGYFFVEDPNIANVVVFVNYGISDPITYQKIVSAPVWGQTGVSSTTTTGNVNVNPYSNSISYTQKTQNNPSYGVTGYRSYSKTNTEYFRFLHLTAFDFDYFKEHDEPKTIWQTEVTSQGSTGDLRQVFPALVGASAEYFGRNSGKKVEIRLYENDQRIKAIKGTN